ncbi:Sau3AI family type II restriction endonuclease [uncultured Granulicatella sp.]|uniref:Sau3AI family type II restriction endonuclease n=1 Tax=uncultured Granulicatella sp. TaxID=316089 RepID=UPI0028E7B0BC|nr:Sau3AI family type II restriction endonuclease [uncultured Granulicatella sp.]
MTQNLFNYDNSNIEEVLHYSNQILNRKFSDILEEYDDATYKTYKDLKNRTPNQYENKEIKATSKGKYGNYIERYYYGYIPNSDPEADFSKIGVELKVTPFKINKDGSIVAKERLVLTILNYMEENLEDFYGTHLWKKCSKILLLFYNGLIPEQTLFDYMIEKVFLFEWFEEDMEVIKEDYERITKKIKEGRAHELSESDGNYLSTCTKGAGKGKDWRTQPFSDEPAKQRAWELKSSYMTFLINNRIFNHHEQESVLATLKGTKKTFTQLIVEKIMTYKGYAEKDLYQLFEVNQRAKGKNSLLIRKMIGLTGDINQTQEFQKANMNLRVIRVDKNNLPKEDSPFKNYQFCELVENNDWEESHVYKEICNKRFMFVIFKESENGEYLLDNVKFWGFPDRLMDEAKRVWEETRTLISNGIQLTITNKGVSTNFPQSQINPYIFTKIHATNTYYEIEKGQFIGKGKLSDTDVLPDGRRITKHSFWMPKKFIQEVLNGKWD